MLLPRDWLDRDLAEIAMIAPLQEIQLPLLKEKAVRVLVKREDQLHPAIGGNKVYKLHGFINDYRQNGIDIPLATFGGAYSNHILALATLSSLMGIPSVGIIRGDGARQLSPTLLDAQKLGMTLYFVSRQHYRLRHCSHYIQSLEDDTGSCYWIPEGGSGYLGAQGAFAYAVGLKRIIHEPVEAIFHACGTGSTFAGIVAGLAGSKKPHAYGVSVLKGCAGLRADIQQQVAEFGVTSNAWTLLENYHCGGYAKYPKELGDLVLSIEQRNGLLLDPVYTSKVMMAICDLIKNNCFMPGSLLVVIHSGGLQGRRGFGLDRSVEHSRT